MSTSATGTVANLANAAASAKAAGATAATSGSASRKGIADNFDAFLSLLTTQLKNQNPTDPLDTNQFTQQLVQFSSVEQQLKTNDILANMQTAFKAITDNRLNAATAGSLVGRRVTVDGSTAKLGTTGANWSVDVPANVTQATVTIADSKGDTVYTGPASFPRGGPQGFAWDGRRTNGVKAAEGETYKATFQGKDRNGANVAIKTELAGTATSVDLSGSEDMVTIDDLYAVPVNRVKTVSRQN
jgi:flagellar basal-body rod modification protein FlgD